jgi:hypothetical protein
VAGIVRRQFVLTACALVMAAAGGGCAQQISGLSEAREAGWFSKPLDLFSKPDWARPSNPSLDTVSMRPVGPEDLVSADGQCPPGPAEAAPAPQPVAAAASAGTGFEGGLQTGPGAPAVMAPVGGIALGMSECQAVRRAGTPSHVAISTGEGGASRVVLTYAAGPWPGIYTFDSGRLKVVDAAPGSEKPDPVKKKKSVKRAKTATAERVQ